MPVGLRFTDLQHPFRQKIRVISHVYLQEVELQLRPMRLFPPQLLRQQPSAAGQQTMAMQEVSCSWHSSAGGNMDVYLLLVFVAVPLGSVRPQRTGCTSQFRRPAAHAACAAAADIALPDRNAAVPAATPVLQRQLSLTTLLAMQSTSQKPHHQPQSLQPANPRHMLQ